LNEVEDKSVGYEMGGTDYITKPFEMSDVLTCIETHLNVNKNWTKRVERTKKKMNASDESQSAVFNVGIGLTEHQVGGNETIDCLRFAITKCRASG
jgi:Response regulators consisting of a CheY-like receiver domain and a winged-helix DNA-binding domain